MAFLLLVRLAYAILIGAIVVYIVHARSSTSWAGRAATGMAVLCWVLLSAGLVQRGLVAGHWPITNRFEVSLCVTWIIITLYLLLEASWRERRSGGFVLFIAWLMITYAISRPSTEQTVFPLLPVLRSLWLQVHVLSTLIGYGAFGVAAGLGMIRLLQHVLKDVEQIIWLPAHYETERNMERAVALGFPWLSLGILTGAIWAQNAWGRYWGWDPKETWALITWLWYLLILHVRALRLWRGRRLAGLIVAGFAVVLFTFVGVPWLVRTVRLESLHGF